MSSDDCNYVSVTQESVEGSDITNNSGRVILSLDMSVEPFLESASDNARQQANEPETGRRPSSGQTDPEPVVGSLTRTMQEVSEIPVISMCVHCHGTGKLVTPQIVSDGIAIAMATAKSTEPINVLTPGMSTTSTMSTVSAKSTVAVKSTNSNSTIVPDRPKSQIRKRSRLDRKNRSTTNGQSKGSGGTRNNITTPTLLSQPKVKVQGRIIDHGANADSSDDMSTSYNGSEYSSGDQQRSVRVDKRPVIKVATRANTKVATAFRKAGHSTQTQERSRPSTQRQRGQHCRKRHRSGTT